MSNLSPNVRGSFNPIRNITNQKYEMRISPDRRGSELDHWIGRARAAENTVMNLEEELAFLHKNA